jgi:hypothetical protein
MIRLATTTSAGLEICAAALIIVTPAPSGRAADWAKAQEERQRAFLLATRDIHAPPAFSVLQSIYTVFPADGRALYDIILRIITRAFWTSDRAAALPRYGWR